jgi:hypothetical protein
MRASAHQQRQVGERAKAPVTDQDVPQLEVRVKELDMSHSLYTRWLQLGSQAERPRPSRSEFDLLPHALSPRPHELGVHRGGPQRIGGPARARGRHVVRRR